LKRDGNASAVADTRAAHKANERRGALSPGCDTVTTQWMQLNTVRPMWVLRLVPGVRFGRLLAAAGIVLLLGAYAAAGMFTGHSPPFAPPTLAVFSAVILAYIVPT
jgi:hypothetical protein